MLKYSIMVVLLVALSLGTMGCGEDLANGIAKETEKLASWIVEKTEAPIAKSDAELAARKAKWLVMYNNDQKMLADVDSSGK